MTRPARVAIVEVGPRDGLQNEARPVSAQTKIALIDGLVAAGLSVIEAGSFVSPKWVPQMANSAMVLAAVRSYHATTRFPVLVPNRHGYEAALAAGAQEIALFVAASESFSWRNINCSIADSMARAADLAGDAVARGLRVRGYVSCVLGCPYEGAVPPERVVRIAGELRDMGCAEISLGDTIGVGTPDQARAVVGAVAEVIGMARVALHFHDTYGQALANLLACIELGAATVDCAVAGLGGCPYAPGATGNVATEDVVYMLDGMGIETGVDLDRLAAVGRMIARELDREPASRVARALAAKA